VKNTLLTGANLKAPSTQVLNQQAIVKAREESRARALQNVLGLSDNSQRLLDDMAGGNEDVDHNMDDASAHHIVDVEITDADNEGAWIDEVNTTAGDDDPDAIFVNALRDVLTNQ
jgi:hypothetical protein